MTISSNDSRARSKTFEEFEKDTDDAWDEEPGDISHLSSDAQLQFEDPESKMKGKQKR